MRGRQGLKWGEGEWLSACQLWGRGWWAAAQMGPSGGLGAWREDRAVPWSPRGSLGAARPDHLSEGTADVEAKDTDGSQPTA